MGTKSNCFEVLDVSLKKCCIIISLKNKIDGFCWHLIVVYGTTYAVDKVDFIAELHKSMEGLCYPVLFGGGDFNLITGAKEKLLATLITLGLFCLTIGLTNGVNGVQAVKHGFYLE